jgi:hypothetical protein
MGLGAMEIGSQKPEIPERFGDIKKKTDALSKLSVLVRRGRVLSYASVTAYGDPLTISKITPAAQTKMMNEIIRLTKRINRSVSLLPLCWISKVLLWHAVRKGVA